MHLCFLLFVAMAVLANAGSTVYTKSLCITFPGTKSVTPVPTAGKTYTKSYDITATTTLGQTITITPKPVTKTTTVFVTSTKTSTVVVASETLTSTSTLVVTSTGTIITTESTTSTVTVTSTSMGNTTASTSPGYIPIQSQISSMGYTPAKKRHALALDARAMPARARNAEAVPVPAPVAAKPTFTSKGQLYPTKAYCLAKVQTVNAVSTKTVAGPTVTRTAKPSTTISTRTSTITVCRTAAQTSASATVTATSTSTISVDTTSTTTVTSTATTTEVVNGPFVTVYPVCQPNNYLRTVNGALIDNIFDYESLSYGPSGVSIDQCCNACQELGDACAAGLVGYGQCYFISQSDGSCDGTSDVVGFDTRIAQTDELFQIFNGNCGRYRYYPEI